MTIAEFKAKGYPIDAHRDRHIRNFDYLDELATDHKISIGHWDTKTFLGAPGSCPTKRDIARAFTVYRKSEEPLPPPPDVELDKAHRAALDEIGKRPVYTENDRQRQIQLYHLIANTSRALNSNIEEYARLRLRAGYKPRTDFARQVQNVMADYGYRWHRFEQAKPEPVLWLITDEIHVKEVNTPGAVDTRVNLGQFKVGVNLVTFAVAVNPYEGNTGVKVPDRGVVYHPHALPGWGGVCWGTATENFRNAAGNHDIYACLSLLYSVLLSYGAGPYAALSDFAEVIQAQRDEKLRAELTAQGLPIPENMGRPAEPQVAVGPRLTLSGLQEAMRLARPAAGGYGAVQFLAAPEFDDVVRQPVEQEPPQEGVDAPAIDPADDDLDF